MCHSEGCGARNPGAVVAVSCGRPEVIAAAPSDQTLPREQRKVANTENVLSVLTDRERQIMRLVSEGFRTKEIGRRLDIVDGTIKVHLHNIFQTLEIGNRTILAKLAISHNDSMGVRPENEVDRLRNG